MKQDLEIIIDKLKSTAHKLSQKERTALEDILEYLNTFMLFDLNKNNKKSVFLYEIEKYLKLKLHRTNKDQSSIVDKSFLDLSKIYIKGAKKNWPDKDKEYIYRNIWRILEENSHEWNIVELSNLLAYCLKTKSDFLLPQNIKSPKKIIRIYKAIFDAQDSYSKADSFMEILMRFSSEPSFKKSLSESIYTR